MGSLGTPTGLYRPMRKLRHIPIVLEALVTNHCEVNAFHYGVSISAFKKAEKWPNALWLLRQMERQDISPNTVTYSACISAMEKGSQWVQGLDLLSEMEQKKVKKNVITVSYAISACAKAGKWQGAIDLLAEMCKEKSHPDNVVMNACISGCCTEWPVAMHLLREMHGFQLKPDIISYSATIAALEEGRQWALTLAIFQEMRSHQIPLDSFSYNALIGSFSRASEWQHALHVFGQKAASEFEMDVHACSAAVSACERAGQWQHVLKLWPSLQDVQAKANQKEKNLYTLSAEGPEDLTRHLKRALELQWAVGYPFLPAREDQLTHGFYKYIAGMQAMCARELLKLIPNAQHVMDMFCGSGTVLVEALRAGKDVVGCDVSPLALLVATHHTDARHIDLAEFLQVAEDLAATMEMRHEGWHFLLSQISELPKNSLRDALHFVLLVALSRAGDATYLHSSSKGIEQVPEEGLSPQMFRGIAKLYASRVVALKSYSKSSNCQIYRCDNRILRLPELVDAIVTGPPYPGVYDYHSPARSCADLLGGDVLYQFCAPASDIHGSRAPVNAEISDSSSSYAPEREIGQNSLWINDLQFAAKWQAQQEEWLASAFENLKEGGTATLMIGDGDLKVAGDGGFDNLQPTVKAAEKAGFHTLATATIRGRSKHPRQPKGMKRTEHMVHLQKPTPLQQR